MLSDETRTVLEAVGIRIDDSSPITFEHYSVIIDHLRRKYSAPEVESRLEDISLYAIESGRSSHADLYRSSSMPRPAAPVYPDNSALYQALSRFDRIFPKIMFDLDDDQIPGALIYSAMRYGLLLDRDLIRAWRKGNFYDGLWQYRNYIWFELEKNSNAEPMVWQPDDMTVLLLVRYRGRIKTTKSTSWHQYLRQLLSPHTGLNSWSSDVDLIRVFQAVLKNYLPAYLVEVSANRNRNRSLTSNGHLRLISRRVPPVKFTPAEAEKSTYVLSRKQHRSNYCNLLSALVRTSSRADELVLRASTQNFSLALQSLVRCAAFYRQNNTQFGGRLKKSGVLRIVNDLAPRFEREFYEIDPESISPEILRERFIKILEYAHNKSKSNLKTSIDRYYWYLHNENNFPLLESELSTKISNQSSTYPVMVMPWEYEAIKGTLYREFLMATKVVERQRIQRMLLAVILGYRSGLRRGEILALRYKDFQHEGLATIVVSKRKGFEPKTRSGNRQIVISGRYSDSEMRVVDRILKNQDADQLNSDRRIFSGYAQGADKTNNKKIFSEISQIIHSVTGDYSTSFHSLRHSFASINLYRMVRSRLSNDFPMDDFLGYDTGENYDAYLGRLAPLPGATRRVNPVYQISAEMGHASPETTLGTYVHSLDWLMPYYQRRMMPSLSTAQLASALGVSRQAIQKITRAHGERTPSDYRVSAVRRLTDLAQIVSLDDWMPPREKLAISRSDREFEFDGCSAAIRRYKRREITSQQLFSLYPGLQKFPAWTRDALLIDLLHRLYTRNEKRRGDRMIQRFSELIPSEKNYCLHRWNTSRDAWIERGFKHRIIDFRSRRAEQAYNYLADKLKIFNDDH